MGRKWWIVAGLVAAAFLWNSSGETKREESLPVFSPSEPTQAAEETKMQGELEFPFVIRGTELIAQCMAQYEGPFLEDAVQEPVSGVMALMVYNPGSQYVRNARIALQQGEKLLLFEITMLPPGGRVLVLEKNKEPYSEEPLQLCLCLSLKMEQTVGPEGIAVTERDGKLLVENQTGQALPNVTLHYKQYSDADRFYLGGRTCTESIGALAPDQTIEIELYRYVSGRSRIVAVTTEQ